MMITSVVFSVTIVSIFIMVVVALQTSDDVSSTVGVASTLASGVVGGTNVSNQGDGTVDVIVSDDDFDLSIQVVRLKPAVARTYSCHSPISSPRRYRLRSYKSTPTTKIEAI